MIQNTDPFGLIFDIDTFAIHDGPGIRMAVYLKGCPLACKWCHSPESQKNIPELIFIADRCTLCGTCALTCPNQVHKIVSDKHIIDLNLCLACGKCINCCLKDALVIKGYRMRASEIIKKAERMKPYFESTKGGITLTGGELSLQEDFSIAVLEGCRLLGIHTAIETCGACSWSVLERILEYTDLVLYDIKFINDKQHTKWTGSSNKVILVNAAKLAGRNVQVRIPLIPGITDTEDNLREIYVFMQHIGFTSVVLLPYNPYSGAKYPWLGIPYEIYGQPQSTSYLKILSSMAYEYGLEASIG